MKFIGLFLTLVTLALVKGEETMSTKTVPAKTLPTATTRSGKTIISDLDDLPVSSLAKKYCRGSSVSIKYDDKDFICESYRYDTSGCAYMYIKEGFYTSFSDECYQGKKVEEGVYIPTKVSYSSECKEKYQHMKKYEFGDYFRSDKWKRGSSGFDYSKNSVDELPVSDLAKEYCRGADTITVYVNDTDFLCVLQDNMEFEGCLPTFKPKTIYSSFNNECINAKEIQPGLYTVTLDPSSSCENNLKDMKSYYIKGKSSKSPITFTKTVPTTTTTTTISTINTTTKTVPISTTTTKTVPTSTTTTKTVPTSTTTTKTVPTSTTTTKTVPTSTTTTKTVPTSTTTTKTVPTSTTTTKTVPTSTTTTKTVPTSTTTTKTVPTSTTTTKTVPTSTTTTKTVPTSTTTTKTVPTSTTTTKTVPTSTTTTKTVPTSTTTTKTIPTSTTTTKTVPTSTTTTKTVPTSTTTTKTVPISTKCLPITKTVTVKETITKKEIVTVTVKVTPTNVVDDKNCASKYAQCGGVGFNGPTCCQSGSTCHEVNKYYTQCI